ncbi:hypothetical protein GIB67_034825 [Kingdonia uniflora]|uniref:DUF4283 domain-containing protein n=1 Tax=Kingdonia uniflora TaxID=39325 RepID=A0A7J7MDW9_9MAGN|nr:hypothetical protein GIB67_034825 [Kingdonia uniflora]
MKLKYVENGIPTVGASSSRLWKNMLNMLQTVKENTAWTHYESKVDFWYSDWTEGEIIPTGHILDKSYAVKEFKFEREKKLDLPAQKNILTNYFCHLDDIPDPVMKGDKSVVMISKEAVELEIEQYKYSLIGRLPQLEINLQEIRAQAISKWKLKGLHLEYWSPTNLMALGKALGTPIRVDNSTRHREFGVYARVLIEIDFAKTIPQRIYYEDEGVEVWQPIQIVEYPKFCSHCKIIDHIVSDCKAVQKAIVEGDKHKAEQEKLKSKKNNKFAGDRKKHEADKMKEALD